MEEDLPAIVAEDPEGGAEGLDAGVGAEGAVGDEGEGGGERLEVKVGEGDVGRVGGFSGEGGEDFGAGVDAAGGAELGEVFGEEELEGFGVLAEGGGEELALERFEVGGEGRVGEEDDRGSLSLRLKTRSQSETSGTRQSFMGRGGCPRGLRLYAVRPG